MGFNGARIHRSIQKGGVVKVFVAAPFSSMINSQGFFMKQYRERLSQLHKSIEESGHSVFASQRNENWGNAPLKPEEYVSIDYHELSFSDVVVAVLGARPSLGVCIELGWASALGIPIIVVGKRVSASTMISGLHRVSKVNYIPADLEDSKLPIPILFNQIEKYLQGERCDSDT